MQIAFGALLITMKPKTSSGALAHYASNYLTLTTFRPLVYGTTTPWLSTSIKNTERVKINYVPQFNRPSVPAFPYHHLRLSIASRSVSLASERLYLSLSFPRGNPSLSLSLACVDSLLECGRLSSTSIFPITCQSLAVKEQWTSITNAAQYSTPAAPLRPPSGICASWPRLRRRPLTYPPHPKSAKAFTSSTLPFSLPPPHPNSHSAAKDSPLPQTHNQIPQCPLRHKTRHFPPARLPIVSRSVAGPERVADHVVAGGGGHDLGLGGEATDDGHLGNGARGGC